MLDKVGARVVSFEERYFAVREALAGALGAEEEWAQ